MKHKLAVLCTHSFPVLRGNHLTHHLHILVYIQNRWDGLTLLNNWLTACLIVTLDSWHIGGHSSDVHNNFQVVTDRNHGQSNTNKTKVVIKCNHTLRQWVIFSRLTLQNVYCKSQRIKNRCLFIYDISVTHYSLTWHCSNFYCCSSVYIHFTERRLCWLLFISFGILCIIQATLNVALRLTCEYDRGFGFVQIHSL